ncbi:predicted protein [Nematostella vectensis]|uniref:EF-hand domain-containing protein n=1 Tax=Nematostella vectensis TaxID=45351 RepID=A7STK5_NEMVE|nr:predicted protein [Nematostella vectensis]|eukprot:XP_001625062.1 predicted protein [Nematostella vectensis]
MYSSTMADERELKIKAKKMEENAKTPIEKLHAAMAGRGTCGIKMFGRAFRIFDDDGNRALNIDEFRKGMQDFGTKLTDDEVKQLFAQFDKDGSGSLDFEEFLRAVRPSMSKNRVEIIMKAFHKMDTTGDGVITIADLKKVYNARQDKRYQSGEMTEAEVFQKFLATFEPDPAKRDGKVRPYSREVPMEGIVR